MQDPSESYFPPKNAKSPASTLHIIGRGDTIVSMGTTCLPPRFDVPRLTYKSVPERCQSLVDKFEDPHVELHDGGKRR